MCRIQSRDIKKDRRDGDEQQRRLSPFLLGCSRAAAITRQHKRKAFPDSWDVFGVGGESFLPFLRGEIV